MTQKKGSPAQAGKPRSRSSAPPSPGPAPEPALGFPVVGVGASAGGLEALEQFLGQIPEAAGMALVVVQHLDPTHKDLMVELLQRTSVLPVLQITDGMPVEPDHVYVLPPNRDLELRAGVLRLVAPAGLRGLRLPIDSFFRSLAQDQQHRSIAVILSGMGADGTNGARAIKEQGGAVFVQTQAKFDAMPRSAMDAGLADRVGPAEVLASQILAYVHHAPLLDARPGGALPEADQSGLEKVIVTLRARNGHDFTFYKKSTLYRRIERRMAVN